MSNVPLEQYPQIEDTQFEKLVLEGRIIKWGYENDLIGFYNGICDVYWNPNRMGAGGSIGSAMRCGLPIVTTNFPSDVLPRLGLENVVDGDYVRNMALMTVMRRRYMS